LFQQTLDKKVNWKEVCLEVLRLDADLEEPWDMAAGMFVPGTLLFQAWGLYLLPVALCPSDVGQWHSVLSVLFSCVPVPLLLLLGGITDNCMSESARSKSMCNIAVSFTDENHLLGYIRDSKMGVQCCRTLMTKKLLIDVLILCVRTYLNILPLVKVIIAASQRRPNSATKTCDLTETLSFEV